MTLMVDCVTQNGPGQGTHEQVNRGGASNHHLKSAVH